MCDDADAHAARMGSSARPPAVSAKGIAARAQACQKTSSRKITKIKVDIRNDSMYILIKLLLGLSCSNMHLKIRFV